MSWFDEYQCSICAHRSMMDEVNSGESQSGLFDAPPSFTVAEGTCTHEGSRIIGKVKEKFQ